MKSEFSTAWLSSTQPRKQRKYGYNAPLHLKHSFLSAHLSKELRKKHSKRSMPVRKGDEVLVMCGSFKKKKAKVVTVNLKQCKIALEGIQRSKKEGAKANIWFNPSVLQIVTLNVDDKRRLSSPQSKPTQEKPAVQEKTVAKEKPKAQEKKGEKHASN
jgi:large subunit ribosomal protein L24